ncbi:mediator of RNA polymerase II transcription subunit 27-like [Stegodyphus dumicola]|uniref:mediator of RNA polymerase II transcription subunit 27-like n=1 Tax=Stegodyphus dumicola TaxID=202533 RepID=UPI0015A77F5D|nr:mediator of RNA polymerase II transcription subunit 27-like [Stegodyphus dumicola]
MVEAGAVNLDALHSGLKAIKSLRSTVLEVFKFLGDGATAAYGDEEREKFISEVQNLLTNVRSRMRDLETASTLLGSPNSPLTLGNSGLLSQDPAYEKTPLYTELIKSYRWFDKVYEHSNHACAILTQNSLKRSNISPILQAKRIRRPQPSGHNIPPPNVDAVTSQLSRLFSDMQIQVLRPCGSSTVLLISLARTLKALVILRGLIIEWVVVKGYNEDFYTENDKLDMWSGSRYKVFQKVTDHANAAMLHFYSPHLPDLAVRSFMTWLRSYNTLFTSPCRRCGNRLHNNMPPTWRDVRNLDVYHEACRP